MSMMKTIAMKAALLMTVAVAGAGCASSVRNMAEVTPAQRLVAPGDQALVVFVRPSKYAYGVSANILDEQGRFLGDTPAKGHFAVALPPGRHMLVVWAENTDALDVELAPGRNLLRRGRGHDGRLLRADAPEGDRVDDAELRQAR